MKKKAFTIAEVAFVMVFIGVISIIAMHTVNEKFTDYFSRYYTAYDSLGKAVYNIYTDTYCRNTGNIEKCKIPVGCEGDTAKDYSETGRPFPTTPKCLCLRMSEYLNASKTINCSDNAIENINGNIEFDKQFYDEKSKPKNTLQMGLSNGFNLFFSNYVSDFKVKSPDDGTDKKMPYFVIYVDLNGSSKPNRATNHPDFKSNLPTAPSKQLARPDIVPFIATSTGELIPVGFPIHDKNYATARISDSSNEQSKSYTIEEAMRLAYVSEENVNHIISYIDIPLTLTLLFEKQLPQCIVPNKSELSNYRIGTVEDIKKYNCEEGTYNCIVKIDENLDKRF